MKMRILLLLFLGISIQIYSQTADQPLLARPNSRKGSLFVFYGYNRAYYGRSDVHFKGDGFDFTLNDVAAEDMPEKFKAVTYFNPRNISIPQFVFRTGYYFNDNTAISVGWDHMKYHIVTTQLVTMNGYIDPEKFPKLSSSLDGAGNSGTFSQVPVLYNPGFMDLHHSNGFNFVRVALEKRAPIWTSSNGNYELAFNGSISAGALFCWTDWTFMGDRYLNHLHLAGYGASTNIGFRFDFWKYFFVQAQAQFGLSNLPNIQLMTRSVSGNPDQKSAVGDQQILFMERAWMFGGYIPLIRKK